MALIGGGGAGNVAGGNPSGTGSSLNYIGDHAYAFSGSIDNSGTQNTLIDFTTANNYITAKIHLVYFTESGSPDAAYTIVINGESVYALSLNGNVSDVNRPDIRLIVPPFSRFQIFGQRISGAGTIAIGAVISGRVYA